ncbi:hypothetical protein QQ045_005805 [Rhodiola kirilowii]
MWKSEIEKLDGRDIGIVMLSSSTESSSFELRGKSWYVSAETPSDLLVQVQDFSFHLHKFPLHYRSGRISRSIQDSCERELNILVLDELPGGSEAFELVAKFCYGVSIDLAPDNISGLRCAAEYLEMTEDMEEGNLISKTESYLTYVVLSSWKDSILVLKSCDERVSPWTENLQIVRRCSDSIAWKACASPEGVRWEYTKKCTTVPNSSDIRLSRPQPQAAPSDWWFEDMSVLRIDHFVRAINAIKVKGMGFELVGAAIMYYAAKWLPGLVNESVIELHDADQNLSSKSHRMIIESIISIIPAQRDSVSCNFLLRLLRKANTFSVSPALVTDLEKRAGMQLEQGTLEDLLIPSYNKCETMYDTDLVQRLLEYFLVQDHMECYLTRYGNDIQEETQRSDMCSLKLRVARLVDGYLTEISRDRNLSFTKFQVLAEALPENARSCDDGLYRAIDSYLKAHPALNEHERKRICRVMDCQKLSMDACLHAAQNERLPLRVVVQVLFHEQQKISQAIARKPPVELETSGSRYPEEGLTRSSQPLEEGWEIISKRDIRMLKFEVENMKAKYLELQHEMDTLQNQLDTKPKQNKRLSALSTGWKKLTNLTKANHLQTLEAGNQTATPPAAEQATKTPRRRWRNSIS